ncbi:MAG: ankyrin repeat domain-containing protein [Chlamydiales bacterium]|nr:ankyrin repeat domain-containing protein [Chlamydiales bacterium]
MTFFEQFYGAHVKHHTHDMELCELAFSSSSGLTLEPTSSYKFYHLWTTYSLPDNVNRIIDAAKTAFDTIKTFDKSTPKERIVRFCQTASQTCFHIDRLVRRDLVKTPQDLVLPDLHANLVRYAHEFLRAQSTLLEANPVQVACQNGNLLAAVELLEQSDCIKHTKGYHTELLKVAYENNKLALCRKLIQEGADPLAAFTNKCQELCTDFLFDAITDGLEDVALILVEAGANLQHRKQGKLALHLAASAGFLPLLQKMIAKGVNINATDDVANTPLHYAVRALQRETALLLLQNGADVARLNAENVCAFYLADEHPDKAAVADFYSQVLAEFAPSKERLLQDGISGFLASCKETPGTYIRGLHGPNPLVIALLFQDMGLAEIIAEQMNMSRYLTYFKKLQSKYPFSDCSALQFCTLQLDRSHFQKRTPELELKAPSRDVSLNELLDFVTAPVKVAGKLYTKTEVSKLVRAFIDRIIGKADLPGLMNSDITKKNQFYEKLLQDLCLKNCIISLKDAPNASKLADVVRVIIELELGEHCAGRYFGILTKLTRSVCTPLQLTFEDEVYLMLAEFRELVLEQCVDPQKDSNRNDYNDLLTKLGAELNIPGFDSCLYFQDLHGHSVVNTARELFFRYYTPTSIIKNCLEPAIKHNAPFRQKFEEWMLQQIPNDWGNALSNSLLVIQARDGTTDEDIRLWLRKNGVAILDGAVNYEEAIQSARRAAYLRMEVYDEDNNVRPLALGRLLARLSTPVVTSGRLQEESSPKTFACDWMLDIIDMVRH